VIREIFSKENKGAELLFAIFKEGSTRLESKSSIGKAVRDDITKKGGGREKSRSNKGTF